MAFENGVFATFYDKAVENKRESEKKGYPVIDNIMYVKIVTPNSVDVVDRPARQEHKDKFPLSLQAYHTGKEPADEGFPVDQWNQITSADVVLLNALNIKTVEQLADVPDSGIHRLGPGGQGLKNRAVKFLENRDEVAELRSKVKELEQKLEKAESTPKTKRKVVRVAAQ